MTSPGEISLNDINKLDELCKNSGEMISVKLSFLAMIVLNYVYNFISASF